MIAPKIITADALLGRDFPPRKWVVDHLMPEGLSVLASTAKTGKTWMAMMTAAVVAAKGCALGREVYRGRGGRVLYLDLEQPERRTQERLRRIVSVLGATPMELAFSHEWPKMGQGGVEYIAEWIKRANHEGDLALVVVDTIARIWPSQPAQRGQNAYFAEYDQLSQLKRLADDAGIGLLLLHHLNKGAQADQVGRISGTAAFSGAADALWLIERERGSGYATMLVTGREVEERSLSLRWDSHCCQWAVQHDPKLDGEANEDGRYGK